ncbi:MAG: glutamyl-tRNA amidotransferase [Lachnospiraceae bacterium]|nr:glutamyl-tRNA amidotransferase [Lachnospiraceae bacterium]
MILVDIFVPSVDKTYDFQLNETAPIHTVIEEIAEMIGQKERTVIAGDVKKLLLCNRSTGEILDKGMTLTDYGMKTGDSMIFI